MNGPQVFNNTERFLLFINHEQTEEIKDIFVHELSRYERNITAFQHMKMDWDFWNAMLYSWTIITTIGYGHLYPTTSNGKIATMIYAIFGIPLMLLILNDLGKLLTKFMKYPGYLLKKCARRLFQYCTKKSRDEIRAAEARDKQTLEIFDLPIPIAVGIVVGWTFLCSAIQMMWENDWDYLVAFYFYFISLSTIGLGDIAPSEPKYLLIMFGNIVIGLSLVSMCINLIQSHLERTYEAGRKTKKTVDESPSVINESSGQDHTSPRTNSVSALTGVESVGSAERPSSRRGSRSSSQSAPTYARDSTPARSGGKMTKLRILGNRIKRKQGVWHLNQAVSEPQLVSSDRKEAEEFGENSGRASTAPVTLKESNSQAPFIYHIINTVLTIPTESSAKDSLEQLSLVKTEPIIDQKTKKIDKFKARPTKIETSCETDDVTGHVTVERKYSCQAEILKKELSEYDNFALMGAKDILDQIRQEDSLQHLQNDMP